MSSESAEAVTAAAVGIAAAILAWNRWITADSMLFGLLLAGLIGLAVAGVVFLVCKVFSYYRKKRHPEAPVVSFFSSEGGMLIASPLEGKLLPLDGIEDPVFSAEVLGKGCAIEPDKGVLGIPLGLVMGRCLFKQVADAARAKLAEDKAKAENEVLRREAAALREQLAKERRRESRREERAEQAAAEQAAADEKQG